MKLVIKAIPNSPRTKVSNKTNREDIDLTIELKAPPEGGKANQQIIDILAKKYCVPVENIQIVRGKNSRVKHVLIKV